MQREFKYFVLITVLPTVYFVSIYFAVSALFPTYALGCGLLAAMFSLGVYLVLFATRRDEPGMPLALLILFPFICITAGALWWLLRWVGLWRPFD